MCSRNCSIAPALNVSAAATTTEYFACCNICATLASDVVFPVPLMPRNKIKNGCPCSFFSLIFAKRSISPALSKCVEILEIRLSLTNFSISFLSTLEPISFSFKSFLIESITSVATSDSKRAISNSNKMSSISFSLSSFSPKLFAALENALRSLSNIVYPDCEGCPDCCMDCIIWLTCALPCSSLCAASCFFAAVSCMAISISLILASR